jgi:protein involved in temperature-dependent protein secretion
MYSENILRILLHCISNNIIHGVLANGVYLPMASLRSKGRNDSRYPIFRQAQINLDKKVKPFRLASTSYSFVPDHSRSNKVGQHLRWQIKYKIL